MLGQWWVDKKLIFPKLRFKTYQHLKVNWKFELLISDRVDIDIEKWKLLYIAKLRACYRMADFTDTKKE